MKQLAIILAPHIVQAKLHPITLLSHGKDFQLPAIIMSALTIMGLINISKNLFKNYHLCVKWKTNCSLWKRNEYQKVDLCGRFLQSNPCCFEKGIIGETYNISSGNELNNLEIIELICKILAEKLM